MIAGILFAATPALVPAAAPLGTEFTYQGRLDSDGSPYNGTATLTFTLWDAETGGNSVGGGTQFADHPIVDGLFTVQLDFGPLVFNGDARWLQIEVSTPPDHVTVTLTPRQPLTVAPYAETAMTALQAQSVTGIDGHSLDSVSGIVVDAVFVGNTGHVGFGESAPAYPLHISQHGTSVDSYPGALPGEQARVQMMVNGNGVTGGGLAISDNGGFFDLNDGYITYLPLATGLGLRVHGSFKVVNNAWPDYVFEDGYDLKTLEEVEAHIAEHGHLPDVPSAKQIHADGVDVSEMNAVLLRKIEEMTLHMIEMRKEIDGLKAEIKNN